MMGEAPHVVPDRGGRTLMKMKNHCSMIDDMITDDATIEMITTDATPTIVMGVVTSAMEIDHLIEDPLVQRPSFLASVEAIHMSGSTRRSTISPSTRFLEMKGSKLPTSTSMTKQTNGGVG